jgi:co-chaperonin GroES (HSP10)
LKGRSFLLEGGLLISVFLSSAEKGRRKSRGVKKDDRVLFGKYTGNEIKIDGVEHLMMREDDILGIIEK